MKRDSRLSWVLHALLHMNQADGPVTSEALAGWMQTNPVVVRRTMGLLREDGIVSSSRGHGGGWQIACPLAEVSLRRLHELLGGGSVFTMGHRNDNPDCLVEKAVNRQLSAAMAEAEALLLARLGEVTLADLAEEFDERAAGWRAMHGAHPGTHEDRRKD